jgi:hypothetical protein
MQLAGPLMRSAKLGAKETWALFATTSTRRSAGTSRPARPSSAGVTASLRLFHLSLLRG